MAKTFSKKAAIDHGFAVTKKNFKFLLCMLAILLVFELFRGTITSQAGLTTMERKDIHEIYSEPAAGDHFYQYLIEIGYIHRLGGVHAKLNNLKNSSELSLSSEWEADRERIFEFLTPYTYRLPFPKPVYYLIAFILWLFSCLMSIGTFKIYLMLSRDQNPKLSELFANKHLIIKVVLGALCYVAVVFGGLLLLILPGLIFAIVFGMYYYFIIDQNLGPVESLKASRRLTKGARAQIALFGLLLILINFVGALCLFIGLLWTIPASGIASVYVYDQLRKQEEPAIVTV